MHTRVLEMGWQELSRVAAVKSKEWLGITSEEKEAGANVPIIHIMKLRL